MRKNITSTATARSPRQPYKHDLLDRSVSSIRTLRILNTRSPEGFIQCKISQTTIESSYTCLSYVWGPPDTTRTILLNGRTYRVRENLFDFLNMAQSKPSLRKENLWIDAICIDQNNIEERTHQVQQMGEVYSYARRVLSWLGAYDSLAPLVHTLHEQFTKLPISYRGDRQALIKTHRADFISHLLHNLYWTRAWVTQEVLLAKSVDVLVSTASISYDNFTRAHNLIYGHSAFGCHPPTPCPFDRFRGTPEERGNLIDVSLPYLLDRFTDMECSIPRDRIFSLLSLAREGGYIQVDYKISAMDLLYQILSSAERLACICTVAMFARLLQVNHLDDLPQSQVGEPYLEFSATRYQIGEGPWNILQPRCYGASQSPQRRNTPAGGLANVFEFGFCGTPPWDDVPGYKLILLWKGDIMCDSRWPSKSAVYTLVTGEDGRRYPKRVCVANEGLEICKQDDGKFLFRLAFWVISRVITERVNACSDCGYMRTGRPKVGRWVGIREFSGA